MFGALAASLLGYQKFVPDMSRIGCSDTWTDPGDGAVIKLLIPSCYAYQVPFDAASNEVIFFIMCLAGLCYGAYVLRAKKQQDRSTLVLTLLALAFAIWIVLRWAARDHVEGSWRPTPILTRVLPPGWTRENYQDNVWRAHGWNETEIADWNKRSAEGAARVARMGSKAMTAFVVYVIAGAFAFATGA
jgi:hypothetical protein